MKRLIRITLTRKPGLVARDILNAVAASRVSGMPAHAEISRLLDEAVKFEGWLGGLIEEYGEGPAFRMISELISDLVELAIDAGRREILIEASLQAGFDEDSAKVA
ncbi:MAG: hypothetical protein AAFV53_02975 [Myxococcota bacterium]